MTEFVKKPIVIQAVQWLGDAEALSELGNGGEITVSGENLLIETREGTMMADLGDWIIRGIAGEVYPCKPEIFEASYEEVSPPSGEAAGEPAIPAALPSA